MRLGITGWPLRETLSPAMHSAALRELGIDGSYEPFPCERALEIRAEAERRGLSGFNVTIPHKTAIAGLLDRLCADAAASGSVNAVKIEDGEYVGENFDSAGFALSFLRDAPIRGGNFIVAGSGGSARSVYLALCKNGASSVTITARSPEKAAAIHEEIGSRYPGTSKYTVPWGEFAEKARGCSGLINCTPTTMTGYDCGDMLKIPEGVSRDCLVFDLVYRPFETDLTAQARSMGLRAKNGLEMLVLQGLLSFRWWTGKEFDAAKMTRLLGEKE